MLADGPVGCSPNEHREDLLSEVRRHILPSIKISGQYPQIVRCLIVVLDCWMVCTVAR